MNNIFPDLVYAVRLEYSCQFVASVFAFNFYKKFAWIYTYNPKVTKSCTMANI